MTRMRLLLTTLLALALCAPPADAASRNQILRDCALDGKLDGKYTAVELRDARQNLPTDGDEYSDCRDQLRTAEQAAIGRKGGGSDAGGSGGSGSTAAGGAGGGSGSATPGGSGGADAGASADPFASTGSPASGSRPSVVTAQDGGEREELSDAIAGGGASVTAGGRELTPGKAGLGAAGVGARDLPTPLLAALVLLGLAASALAVPSLRSRVPAFRRRG